jgi:hypothetical protein
MDTQNAGSLTPFSKATRVERLDSHTYRVNLVDSYCIGTGEHGHYVIAMAIITKKEEAK